MERDWRCLGKLKNRPPKEGVEVGFRQRLGVRLIEGV